MFPSVFLSHMDDDTVASPLASSGPPGNETDVVDVANDKLDSTRRHGVNIKGGGGGSCGSCNDNRSDPMDDNRGVSGDVNDMNMGDADGVDEQLL